MLFAQYLFVICINLFMSKKYFNQLKCCLLYIFLSFSNFVFSQKSNYTIFDTIPDIAIVNLGQLDSIVNNYTVFFTGENHTYANQNSNIELKMLKYLNEKAGVRNLIIELGFSRGYMLNKYINDDTTFLKNMEGTTSTKYINLYKKLRAFNQSLPKDKRIKVHGIDVERFADDGPVLLNRLLPKNKKAPKEIEFQLEVLNSYAKYISTKYNSYNDYYKENIDNSENSRNYYGRGFDNESIIDSMIADYNWNKLFYKDFLDTNFVVFDEVFNSIIEYRKWQNYKNMPHQYIYRERMIYDNLSVLILANPNEKYYGQFGRCHISQTELNAECNWYAFNSTAKRLNEGVAKGKTLSIGIFYKGTSRYTTSNNYRANSDFFEDKNTTDELKKYIDIECTKENIIKKIESKDTLLLKHFQFLMVNNVNCTEKAKVKNSPNKKDKYDFHEWAVMLDFGIGNSYFDFKNLNSNGYTFNNILTTNAFGYTYSDFGNYNVGKLDLFHTQQKTNGVFSNKLTGYSISESYGYSPHISNRFALGLYATLAYQRMALTTKNDTLKNTLAPGFQKEGINKFINHGITAGAGLDLRFAFTRFLGIYARGHYMFDLTKNNWKIKGETQGIIAPKTLLNNYGFTFGISILIQE